MLSKNTYRKSSERFAVIGIVALLFMMLTTVNATATILTWTNGGDSGSWHNENNWDPAQLPAEGDDVIIPEGTSPVTYSSGTTNLNSLSCSGTLTISGGTLGLSSASSIGTTGTLNLSSGTLSSSAAVTVSGTFNWTAGTLTGGGSMTIGGTAAIGWVTLDDFDLINTGTITWTGGFIYFYNGAGIDNQAAGSFLIDTVSSISYLGYFSGASAGTFTNAGTLTKSGAGTVQFIVPFTNSAAVDLSGGTLVLYSSGTHTGSFAIAAGQTLQISGNQTFDTDAVISGSGDVVVSGTASFAEAFDYAGAVTITGSATFGAGANFIDLTLSSGTLSSSAAVTVSGAFNWTAGTLTGGGSMTIGGTAAIGWVTLDDFDLINTGTITWTGGFIYFYNGAGIDNQAAGSFLIDTVSGISYLGYFSGASAGTFTNAGTLTKSGAGTVQLNVPFTNSAAVDLSGGTLVLYSSGTHTGSFAIAAGQTLQISGNQTFDTDAVISGSGDVVVSGTASFAEAFDYAGAVTITGSATFGAGANFIDLTLSSGTLSSSAAVTVSGAFNWTAGTLTGGGSMTIGDTAVVVGWVTLDDFVLINTGTITWAGGLWIYFYNGAGIDNQAAGSFLIDTVSGTSYLGYFSGASAGTFTNAGTLTKSGAGTVQFNVPFTNSNAVDINGGTLALASSSTHTGSFAVAAGQTLQIIGNHSFEAGTVISGSGDLVVSGTASFAEAFDYTGAVTISGSATFGAGANFIDLTLSSGTLTSSGAVTVSGTFNWTAGTLTGGGSMTIGGTAAVGGWVTLDDFVLINTGTITWAGGLWIYFYNGAGIDNQAAGSFLIDTVSGTSYLGYFSGASAGTFTNAGTLTKSGAGTVQFIVPFTNSGTMAINAGVARLTRDITSTGTVKGIGTLDASSINFINAGQVQPGTSPGTLNFLGTYRQTSNGSLGIDIAGESDYDRLVISSTADMAGILEVALLSPFIPANGNSFAIVTSTALSGLFTQINFPVLPVGLAWQYNTLPAGIELYCGIDSDHDGLTDLLENAICTQTNEPDSDADGLLDGEEDANKNGQREPGETDPCDDDTDNDTIPDGWEAGHGLDPLDDSDCEKNYDSDTLTNCEEFAYGTDPNNPDTDGDSMPDGWEVDNSMDPLTGDDALADADQDGYCNLREYLSGSNPRNELDLPAILADVDTDIDCDGYDLEIFASEYGSPDCNSVPCQFDLDLDNDVDEIDLFLFSEDYGSIGSP